MKKLVTYPFIAPLRMGTLMLYFLILQFCFLDNLTGQTITRIIDATGDGAGNTFSAGLDLAIDGSGNVYVVSFGSNAFKITPGGVITQIIDATGDGVGNKLNFPTKIATDASGNVFVPGYSSDNAFKITPSGVITQIIDATGDGAGNVLDGPSGMGVDASGNVYVCGNQSDNVFKITPEGVITEIIDATGGGPGNRLETPNDVDIDGSGNVYVIGARSNNILKITPGGVITEVIDATGDGAGNVLNSPQDVTIDGAGNVYVTGNFDNVFKITPGGIIIKIIDFTGDGMGNMLDQPIGVATSNGDVYVAGLSSNNVFKIMSGGVITQILDATGDGTNALSRPGPIEIDGAGNIFVGTTGAVFKITPGVLPVEWMAFEARAQVSKIVLEWKTASELLNEGFTVQRSRDGSTWENLDFVPGQGTTQEPHQYQYLDDQPFNGNNYYRLKQIDLDGQYAYSKVVNVDYSLSRQDVKLWPNPTQDGWVRIEFSSQQPFLVKLLDPSGRVVYQKKVSGDTRLNLTGLSSGLYLIQVSSEGQKWVQSLVVE